MPRTRTASGPIGSPDPAALPHYLSPSRVARYFYHQCPRHLRYHATPKERRAVEGIPDPPYDSSPVTQAILDGGYVWEGRVVENMIRGRVVVNDADSTIPLRDRVFSAAATLDQLAALEPGQFLYQGTLIAPSTLYAEYGLDPAAVVLSPCRPDLVQLNVPGPSPSPGPGGGGDGADGTASLRIVDLKASTSLKTSHRVQVGFYSMILSHVIAASGLDRRVDRDAGGVWLFGHDAPEVFDLRTVIPHLSKLLREDLPGVLDVPAGDVPWHFSYRCEWCEYFEHCGAEAERTRSVSLLPYLTTPGRNHLRTAAGVESLADMAEFLSRPDAPAVLAASASLAGRKDRLDESLRSLTSGEVRSYGASSVAMPRGENIRLLLTAQREPVSGATYAAALLRFGGAEVFSGRGRHETQYVASGQGDCRRIQRDFIEEIHRTLRAVHEYNEGKAWIERRSLQAYVFDSYERELLIELLQAGLRDPAVAEKALALLFHFHSECLVIAEEHPAEETDFPLIVLSGVIRALFALPLAVSYHLADVVQCLPPAGDREPFEYSRSDYFDFRLSNALRSDAIHAAWHKGSEASLDRVAVRLRMRLWAASSVVDGIRAAATGPNAGKPLLFAWPPKFRLPAVRVFQNPLLSRAAFIARYESMLSYLDVRSGRALPRPERELNGGCLRLRATREANWFEAEPRDGATQLELDSFGRWLLTEDSWEGEQAQLGFPDQRYPSRAFVPKGHAVIYASLQDRRTGPDGRVELKLALTAGRDSPPVLAGRRYLLHRTFVDANSSRITVRLAEIDARSEPAAAAMLADPVGYGARPPGRPETAAAAQRLLAGSMFTASQKQAFEHVLQHSLTLVWGPPGTGKTHFLAQTVLNLLDAAAELGQGMRVLVTANTHAAIENCLRKIADLQSARPARQPLVKLGPIQTAGAQGAGLESVRPKDGCYLLSHRPRCVIGATTLAMLRMFEHMPAEAPFDVVVVDEAAQVRVPESLLAVSRLAPGGRLIVAGDDLQLPPIVKGAYPPPEPGQPRLHMSIFEVLREPDRGKDLITVQLLENFRMNDSLCRFPSDALYGPGYTSTNKTVAARRLTLAPAPVPEDGPRWLEDALDPDYPWVLCVLEGVQAGAENTVEAGLVAAVAAALRARLCLDGGRPLEQDVAADREFWRTGLFIVSPHHVQIRAIRRALADLGLEPPFFIDTVDKMQGQECESVIVSYGLSDSEQAMQEGEFIYNLNRLNVAITRARSKCVVFLPRPLLEPPLQVLEMDDAVRGVNYMLQLEKHVSSGERRVYDIGHGRLVLYRTR